MTQLDLSVDPKKQSSNEEHPDETTTSTLNRKIHELLTDVGIELSGHEEASRFRDQPVGVDWAFIARIGNAQFVLAVMSSLCLFLSMAVTGFNFFRFTSSAWATYLLTVAYVAIRAGRWQSYAHVIAYTGMVTFQTVVYMSSLCWLVYSLYALDYHLSVYRSSDTFLSHDISLLLVVAEIISIMGTIFTGVFGLFACCRGLGKLLEAQERLLMAQQERGPQITVRPLI